MSGVAVDIVTGFLGSGKTTLLRHALTNTLAGHRVAVIVNAIGDIGIDARVISGLEHVESMNIASISPSKKSWKPPTRR